MDREIFINELNEVLTEWVGERNGRGGVRDGGLEVLYGVLEGILVGPSGLASGCYIYCIVTARGTNF